MRLDFHSKARAEVISATQTYRAENVETGRRFSRRLREVLELIVRFPSAFAPDRDGVRMRPLLTFPYGIAYRVNDDFVQVLALAHQRRVPGYGRDRL